jgi:hypothetical protein
MALPKLVGQGVSSAAGAIGKSVKTGAKAFGALAASQMEPEALAGIAGIKTLAGKFKGGRGDSGDLSQLQQSVEEVAPETTGPIVEKLEQIPPQTSEPIVEKIEELKESEANLEPVIEKLDELTPMVEKIDQLAEQNETDLFNSNFILDNINQGIEKISSLFESMVQRKAKEKSDSLEEKREASRSTRKSKSRLSLPTRDRTGGGGGFFDILKGLFSGPLMSLLAGGAGGGLIGIITAALPIIGGILAAVLPIALPLILTAATAAGIFAFLKSEMADDISTWIAGTIFDAESAMAELNRESARFIKTLTDGAARIKAEEDKTPEAARTGVAGERAALDEVQSVGDPFFGLSRNNREITRINEAMKKSDDTLRIEIARAKEQIIEKEKEVKVLSKQKDPGFMASAGRLGVGILQMLDLNPVFGKESFYTSRLGLGGAFENNMNENLGITDAVLTNAEFQLEDAEERHALAVRNLRHLMNEQERRRSITPPVGTDESGSPAEASNTTIGTVDNSNSTTTNVSFSEPDRRPNFGGNLVASPGMN